jgi:hypothetical protein
MSSILVSDEEPHVMLLTLIDFLEVLESDLEPDFFVFMVVKLVSNVGELVIFSLKRRTVEQ